MTASSYGLGGERNAQCTSSGIFDFAEEAAGNIVDKAAGCDLVGDPGVRAELLQLMANIFIDVLEGVEEGRCDGGGSCAILNSGAQILFAGLHQSAIRVIDDHDFLGAQQIV